MIRALRRFARSRDGAVTAEYVIVFPLVFMMTLVVVELCFLMVRATMLERGLDLTVRALRLGDIANPTVTELEQRICNEISMFPACTESMVLEFTQVDLQTFAMPDPMAPCTRRSAQDVQARTDRRYDTGAQNALMIVRACVEINSITPLLGDFFRPMARAAYVNEPSE